MSQTPATPKTNSPQLNAVQRFQLQYREEWGKILASDLGRALTSALYSRKPQGIPSDIPSQDSHRLGQILNFDLMMSLIAVELAQLPVTPTVQIKQDYADDPLANETKKKV